MHLQRETLTVLSLSSKRKPVGGWRWRSESNGFVKIESPVKIVVFRYFSFLLLVSAAPEYQNNNRVEVVFKLN